MKNILLAHDGSKTSDKALREAIELVLAFKSQLSVVSVVPDLYLADLLEVDRLKIVEALTDEARRLMKAVAKKAARVKKLKTFIVQGNPAEEVLKVAGKIKADLIVTGSHGRHGARKFLLGSVSSKIIDHAECAVLVIK